MSPWLTYVYCITCIISGCSRETLLLLILLWILSQKLTRVISTTYIVTEPCETLQQLRIPPWTRCLVAENLGLKSLKGCPSSVTELRLTGNKFRQFDQHFPRHVTKIDVSHNLFESLESCPITTTHLRISNNPLRTLRGCPSHLQSLGCSYTHITNFKGCEEARELRSVVAAFCFLNSLAGLHDHGYERIYTSYNQLRSCLHAPRVRNLDVSCNELENLSDLPEQGIDELCVSNNKLRHIELPPSSSVTRLRCCGNPIVSFGTLPRGLRFLQALKTNARECCDPRELKQSTALEEILF